MLVLTWYCNGVCCLRVGIVLVLSLHCVGIGVGIMLVEVWVARCNLYRYSLGILLVLYGYSIGIVLVLYCTVLVLIWHCIGIVLVSVLVQCW